MKDIKNEIVDYLSRKKFITLATSTPDGKPLISDKKVTDEILKLLGQKFPTMANLISDPDNLIIKITPKICYFTDYIKHAGIREKVEY